MKSLSNFEDLGSDFDSVLFHIWSVIVVAFLFLFNISKVDKEFFLVVISQPREILPEVVTFIWCGCCTAVAFRVRMWGWKLCPCWISRVVGSHTPATLLLSSYCILWWVWPVLSRVKFDVWPLCLLPTVVPLCLSLLKWWVNDWNH